MDVNGEDNFMKKYKQLVKSVQIMVLSMAMVVMGVGEFVPNTKVQATSKDITDGVITPWVVYSAGQMGRSNDGDLGWPVRYFYNFYTTSGEEKNDWDLNFKNEQYVDSGEEIWQTQKSSKGFVANIACTGWDAIWDEKGNILDDNPYMLSVSMKSIKLKKGRNYSISMDFTWENYNEAPEKNVRIDVKDSKSNILYKKNICIEKGKKYKFSSKKINSNVYEINTEKSDTIELTIAMGAFTCSYLNNKTSEKPAEKGMLTMSNFKIIDEGEIPGYVENKSFQTNIDGNNFIHSSQTKYYSSGFKGVNDYKIDELYFKKLTKYSSDGEKSRLRKWEYNEWKGSCYGIATTIGMVFKNIVNISDITNSSAKYFFALPYPYKDSKLLNTIQYFQLSQSLERGGADAASIATTSKGDNSNAINMQKFWESVVDRITKDGITLFTFTTAKGGHAVLMLDCEKEDDKYKITIFDENTYTEENKRGYYTYLYLSSDFREFTWDAEGLNKSTYKEMRILDWNRMKQLDGSGYAIGKAGNGHYFISLSLEDNFTLKNQNGKYIHWNGESLETTMKTYSETYGFKEKYDGEVSTVTVEVDGDFNYEVCGMDKIIDIDVTTEEQFLSVEGENISNVKFNKDEGIILDGENKNYTFSTYITTNEKIDDEKNLVRISGKTVGETGLERNGKSIELNNKNGVKNIEATNYVGENKGTIMYDKNVKNLTVGNIYKNHGHNYQKIAIQQANIKENGLITERCSVCNKEKTSTIARINNVEIDGRNIVFNGKPQKPKIVVRDDKAQIVPKLYYTVKYINNVNVGNAKIVLSFKGKYRGVYTAQFNINPPQIKVKRAIRLGSSIITKWKKTKNRQKLGVIVQCSQNTKFNKGVVTKRNTLDKGKVTIKNIKEKKKYFVRVRTYKIISGRMYYSKWSNIKKVTTKKK